MLNGEYAFSKLGETQKKLLGEQAILTIIFRVTVIAEINDNCILQLAKEEERPGRGNDSCEPLIKQLFDMAREQHS